MIYSTLPKQLKCENQITEISLKLAWNQIYLNPVLGCFKSSYKLIAFSDKENQYETIWWLQFNAISINLYWTVEKHAKLPAFIKL